MQCTLISNMVILQLCNQVQATSEFGKKGEWQVEQLDNVYTDATTTPGRNCLVHFTCFMLLHISYFLFLTSFLNTVPSGSSWYLYLIVGVIFVIFVVFIVILSVSIYYYYKRNKVVILKVRESCSKWWHCLGNHPSSL